MFLYVERERERERELAETEASWFGIRWKANEFDVDRRSLKLTHSAPKNLILCLNFRVDICTGDWILEQSRKDVLIVWLQGNFHKLGSVSTLTKLQQNL